MPSLDQLQGALPSPVQAPHPMVDPSVVAALQAARQSAGMSSQPPMESQPAQDQQAEQLQQAQQLQQMATPATYKTGGVVHKTGLALVHRGERVLTSSEAENYARWKDSQDASSAQIPGLPTRVQPPVRQY